MILEQEGFDGLAFDGLDLFVVLEVLGVHGARSDVVGEYVIEFLDVLGFEEVVEESLGEFGEGFVGGGEDGEGTSTREGVDKLAGLEGGDEGGEIGSGDGKVNDGGALGVEFGHGV